MRLKITITNEAKDQDSPLFVFAISVLVSLLSVFAVAVLGINTYERRIILGFLVWLLYVNILATYNAFDRIARRWYFRGRLLFSRRMLRVLDKLAAERDEAVERAKAKRIEIDTLQARVDQLEKDLRDARRDLEERERQLGAEQRKNQLEAQDKEVLRTEAQTIITGLKDRIKNLEDRIEAMKERGQSIVEYALILLFIMIVCVGILSQISPFPITIFTQLMESIP